MEFYKIIFLKTVIKKQNKNQTIKKKSKFYKLLYFLINSDKVREPK
jgi:hypothetical protein